MVSPESFRLDSKIFPGGSEGKASACNVGDPGSVPGLGRSPEEGNGSSLHYSCLENPMNGGAWWSTVHRAVKSQTRLSDFTFFLSFSKMFSETGSSAECILLAYAASLGCDLTLTLQGWELTGP